MTSVKGRIHHLEQLVVELMNNKTSPDNKLIDASLGQGSRITPPESGGEDAYSRESVSLQSIDEPASSLGQLKIRGTETSYVGSAHWESVLESISDLKNELDNDDDDNNFEPTDWHDGSDIPSMSGDAGSNSILHSPIRLTKSELLAALPSRAVVDLLVSTWWNSSDPFKTLIHKVQFEREYRQFWREPSKAPTMWLGLLYAIMSLACFFRLQSTNDLTSPLASSICAEAGRYHDLSASAAVLADYTVPKAYVIECLLLYSGSWRIKGAGAALDVWLLLGVTVRSE